MASFTSEIATFNPYIAQIPDSFVQVGMIKQQAYNQGVQQVQSYISSIAGLDVLKPEHRDYIDRRVGELTTTLNKLPSGTDFSEQSLINQVGGYAGRLASDPIIQNATASTANHKKQLQYIDEEKKKGVDTTRNEWDYYKQLNQWMTDGDVTSSFTGRFSPVVDVMGEFYKAFKEAHPDSQLTQDAFRVGADGKVQLNEAMEQVSREGISPNKVQSIANTVFSRADVKNQLRIDGQFSYRGFDQSQLAESVKHNYQSAIDQTNTDVQAMRTQMTTDKTVDKVAMSRKIKERTDAGVKLTEDYKQYASLIATDPESAKVALYQNNLMSNMMNSFSWTKGEQKIVDNPLYKAKMDMLNYNLQASKFEWDQKTDQADLQIKQAQLDIDKERLNIERNKASKTVKGANGEDITIDVTEANVPQDQGKVDETTFENQLNTLKSRYSNMSADFVNVVANNSGSIPPKRQLPDGRYVWNTGPGGYSTPADAEREYNRLFTQAHNDYTSGKANDFVNNKIAEMDPVRRQMTNMETIKNNVETVKKETMSKIDTQLKKDVSGIQPITLKLQGPEGKILKSETITPADMVDAIRGTSNKIRVSAQKAGAIGGREFIFQIKDKDGSWVNISSQFGDVGVTVAEQTKLKDLYRSIKDKNADKFTKYSASTDELDTYVQGEYKKAQSAFVPLQSGIITAKNETRETVNQIFVNKLSALAEGNKSSEVRSLLEWTTDGKKANDKIDQNSYGVYYDRFTDKSYMYITRGKETRRVEVPKDVASSIPGIQLNDPFWDKHGSDLSVSGGLTTDIPVNGKKQGEGSAYLVPPVPGHKYTVKYHLTGDSNKNYGMSLYVRDDKGNIVLDGVPYVPSTLSRFMTGAEVMSAVETLKNDAVIQGIINRNSK
jgi:hypothetical protein